LRVRSTAREGSTHSKTLARCWMRPQTRSVLDCGSPLPLLGARKKEWQFGGIILVQQSGVGPVGVV
jgi:hypothetical protein